MSFFSKAKQTYAANVSTQNESATRSQEATKQFIDKHLSHLQAEMYQLLERKLLEEFAQKGEVATVILDHEWPAYRGNLARHGEREHGAPLDKAMLTDYMDQSIHAAFTQLRSEAITKRTLIETEVTYTGVWDDGFCPYVYAREHSHAFILGIKSQVRFTPPLSE
ncbi:MAG: hypothetical protein ACTJG2_02855 [Candidatus Saccharimonadales bacterium]